MIFLARHGETEYNRTRRFQGQSEVPLNATGLRQAQELAQEAAGHEWAALWASPVRRARETAEIVAAQIGLEPRFDARFAEHDVGEWQDRLFDEVEREHPARWARWQAAGDDWAFPDGEGLEEFQDRVIDGVVAVTQSHALPALVVCHRGVIRAALCHTRPGGLDEFQHIPVPNGALIPL